MLGSCSAEKIPNTFYIWEHFPLDLARKYTGNLKESLENMERLFTEVKSKYVWSKENIYLKCYDLYNALYII